MLDAAAQHRRGRLFVGFAAIAWSTAGLLQRELTTDVPTQLAGRSFFAVIGVGGYILVTERGRVLHAFRAIGTAGVAIAALLAVSSSSFFIALNYTSVANVLFMQALAPIIAAAFGTMIGDRVAPRTWVAMAVALAGVALMVGGPGRPSAVGLTLSLVMSVSFAATLVLTRHRRDVSMAPAMCLSQVAVFVLAAPFAQPQQVGALDLTLFALLGIAQIGLGFIFLTIGARLIPAGEVALITLLEIVLGPLWVWLFLSEGPSAATFTGRHDRARSGAAPVARRTAGDGDLAESCDGGPVVGIGGLALDERMPPQLVAHRRAQRAGASAVDDPYLMETGESRIVDEATHLLSRLLPREAANVELVRHVAARRRAHLHRRCAVLGHALAGRAQPRERNADALPGRTDHLGIVATDGGDRPAHSDIRRLDRVALGERAALRQRPTEIAQRTFGAIRTLGRRAEQAVLLGLALPPPGEPQVVTEGAQLGPRLGQLALRLGHRLQARAVG